MAVASSARQYPTEEIGTALATKQKCWNVNTRSHIADKWRRDLEEVASAMAASVLSAIILFSKSEPR